MAYLAPRTGSARFGALGLTLALNGAALVALIAWNPQILPKVPDFFPVINIDRKVPPPIETPPIEQHEQQRATSSSIETTATVVETRGEATVFDELSDDPIIETGTGPRIEVTETRPIEPPPAVLVGAKWKTRADDLQPPYPPGLQRLEVEGSITVRIHVGADGRADAIDYLRGDERFLAATRSWGLRRWRFSPATRDGTATDAWLTQTVKFELSR